MFGACCGGGASCGGSDRTTGGGNDSGGVGSVALVVLFTVGSPFLGKFFIQSGALNSYFYIS